MPTSQYLSQAPLIHVVAQVHFSRIPKPKLEAAAEEGGDLHMSLIEEGFPERVRASQESVELNFQSGDRNNPEHTTSQVSRFVFKGAGDKSLVELREDCLFFKVTEYDGHTKFLDQWFKILDLVSGVVPVFNQVLFQSMSLRYVDLIVPKKEEELKELVTESLMSPHLPDVEDSLLFGSTIKVVRTGDECHLRVMFEELLPEKGSFTKLLPDDLLEPHQDCTMSIRARDHWGDLLGKSYGLLDIEHAYVSSTKPPISHVNMREEFCSLHDKTSRAFFGIVTDKAIKSWS